MIKSLLFPTVLVFLVATPAIARAQSAPTGAGSSCPPGSWFCAEPPQQHATPAGQPLQPLPDPEAPAQPSGSGSPGPKQATQPPVVVYQPPPPTMIDRPDAPPPYEYVRPRRPPISPPHEWGLNLHLEGAVIGSGSQGNAGLGGAGAGLRFKPVRSFGIEADLDFAGGDHDYQGNKRSEAAFTLSGLLFLNPRSHAQIYLVAGFGWSGAHVTCDSCTTPVDNHYNYFGGQLGAGLELRLTRVLALNLDVRGFVRGRTDQLALSQPEFDDPAGCSANPSAHPGCRSTNTSGGALITGGMTLYF
jgi:opacity protein-like surface antigen